MNTLKLPQNLLNTFSCGTDIHGYSTRHATDYRQIKAKLTTTQQSIFLHPRLTPDLKHYTTFNLKSNPCYSGFCSFYRKFLLVEQQGNQM